MELELKDYVKIIKKRWWLVLAIVLVSCLAAGVISYIFMEPIYQASTVLFVNKTEEQNGVASININDVNLNIKMVDTYKVIIKTPYIMEMVAQEHPEFGLTPEQLIDKVQVSSVNNTQVMTLSVKDASHEKAVEIVNAISRVFQREIPNVMKVDNVTILSEAQVKPNPTPVEPNPVLNIAIAFVVSLMVGVGLAFLLEYLDDTVKTEDDVQQLLGLPTLATIIKIKDEDYNGATAVSDQKGRVHRGESTHANVIH